MVDAPHAGFGRAEVLTRALEPGAREPGRCWAFETRTSRTSYDRPTAVGTTAYGQ